MTNVNRIVAGRRTPTDVGLYVSKPSFNVLTCADVNLMLSTKYRTLQIVAQGTLQIAVNARSVAVTIPDFGFKPQVCIASRDLGPSISLGVAVISNTQLKFYMVGQSSYLTLVQQSKRTINVEYYLLRKICLVP